MAPPDTLCHYGQPRRKKQMAKKQKSPDTLEGIRELADAASPSGRRPWIGRSAAQRICSMVGVGPGSVPAEAATIRPLLRKVRPAAHGMSRKTWANLLSRFRMELRLAG